MRRSDDGEFAFLPRVLHHIQTYADSRSFGMAVTWATPMSRGQGASRNRNQVKGAAKDVAGKVQRKVGELTGNENQQAKGTAKQVEGKVQKGVGNVEQALDKADRKTR